MRKFLLIGLTLFTGSLSAQHSEFLDFNWNDEGGWKTAFQQEDEKMLIIQYIPENQTMQNWKEIGTIQMIKMQEIREFTVQQMMEIMYQQGLQTAPKAKLTFISQNDTLDYPWIQFKIEAAEIGDAPEAESQLYHLIQGKETLFVIIWGIRRAEIYEQELEKWSARLSKAEVGNDP